MRHYSFIKPKLKPLFSSLTKLWLGFIGLVVLIMLLFNTFISIRISSMNNEILSMQKNQNNFDKKSMVADTRVDKILFQKGMVEDIYASNEMLKASIKNLFDLVPDQITLSKVIMEKHSLILYGTTPSKDTYNFLLASPLRSIFNTSNTVFYLNDMGWYKFVSTNKIQNQDTFNE